VAKEAPTRVLIVAHQTATSPDLLKEVKKRARRKGSVAFTLVVPSAAPGLHRVVDPQDHGGDAAADVVRRALPGLEKAAGQPVDAIIGDANPLDAVQDAVNLHGFDEIIISTLPHTVSRWLRLDLPHKLEGLGLPVTTVTTTEKMDEDAAVSI
jgi:hypothetical protein